MFLLFPLVICHLPLLSQVSIIGPVCVVPGTSYEYTISGTWDSTAAMQVCVSGGTILDTSASGGCTVNGAPLAAVVIAWNDGGPGGSLTVTTSQGNASLNVAITSPLLPGMIDSAVISQTVDTLSIPLTITCLPDTGGSCSPVYVYQWQQSDNAVDWVDMAGDSSQNLGFTSPMSQTTYFRRKVTETGSGSIGYSTVAVVFVNTEP